MARTIRCGVVRRVEIQNFKVFARKMKQHKPLPHHKMTNFLLVICTYRLPNMCLKDCLYDFSQLPETTRFGALFDIKLKDKYYRLISLIEKMKIP